MINYLIVDDEPQARKLLLAYLQEIPSFKLIKLCSNAMEAYEALQTSKVDLMFLDIKMPILSGTDFLRSLKNPPYVIFTSAFNKYAMEGYELNVVDYLLKPISLPRLLTALEKVKHQIAKPTLASSASSADYIFVKVEHKLVKVNFDDILLVEGMQNYIKLHLKGSILIATHTMKAIEKLLPAKHFLRVHRSFIVQSKSIIAVIGNTIETSYQHVQIGQSFKSFVIDYVNGKSKD